MISIRLPPEITKRLNQLAKRTGRTKTFYAKEAILEHLDELEDIYLSLDRLERPQRRWTQEELENEIDMEG